MSEATQTGAVVETKEAATAMDKTFRQQLDAVLQGVKAAQPSRERALTRTKIEEAIMWLGMDLKRINDGVSCYPGGYDPKDPTIHPVDGGLKL